MHNPLRDIKYFLFLIQILLTILLQSIYPTMSHASEIFKDVSIGSWYYEDVFKLSQSGIVNGYPDGTFRPDASITNAEVLKILMGVKEIKPIRLENSDNSNWADGFIAKADELKIIDSSKLSGNNIATRQLVADILVKVLNERNAPQTQDCFADTNSPTARRLYELGIIKGYVDDEGKRFFKPYSTISRAEITSLAVRLQDYITKDEIYPSILSKEPIFPGEIVEVFQPMSVEDLKQILLYAIYNQMETYTIKYNLNYTDLFGDGDDKFNIVQNLKQAIILVTNRYPEFLSSIRSVEYLVEGISESQSVIRISPKGIDGSNRIYDSNVSLINASQDAIKQMIDAGELSPSMTEREKAYALYTWVCTHVEYDSGYDLGNAAKESFTGYGAIHLQKAVCEGYTSLFNMMMRLLGIKVQGVAGTAGNRLHMWTMAQLDGISVMIDTTWGDTGGSSYNAEWFAQSPESFLKTHHWEASLN